MDSATAIKMIETLFPVLSSIGTVAMIVALTLTIVQHLKDFPVIVRLHTVYVSAAVGAILTIFAYYTHQIGGSLPMEIAQVILGVWGPSTVFEILNKQKSLIG